MTKLRVLAVDDEAGTRNLLARVLRTQGYEVTVADSAYAARETMHAGPRYDVVVADLIMPGEDGEAMIRGMRSTDPDLRFVVVSGKLLSSADRERLRAIGVPHLPKPYRIQELLRTIEQITEHPEVLQTKA